ncbi:MAG: F0F1 ATP synthase subunit epsilon [Rhodobacteraceae bacterium]|jgi:F-type H+-transporting ATPase subunit epsilon|nr:F0F1 ATP synthase subunit epsilon [Paracoccaceae bacterium]
MADTMQFDLVSPERRLASVQAREVRIPGAEGDMTAMPDHAPTITTLRPGVLRVVRPDGEDTYAVTGGFAEIGAEGVTVLAERAMLTKDLTREVYDSYVAEARAALDKAREGGDGNLVDEAAKLLADMVAMGDHIAI